MGRLDGKVAIITGGGNGMGRVACERFATEGASVVVADNVGDAAREVATAITSSGGQAIAVEVDVSDETNPLMSVLGGQPGIDESALSGLKDMLGSFGRKTKRQKMKVPTAWRALTEQEVDKLIDADATTRDRAVFAKAPVA